MHDFPAAQPSFKVARGPFFPALGPKGLDQGRVKAHIDVDGRGGGGPLGGGGEGDDGDEEEEGPRARVTVIRAEAGAHRGSLGAPPYPAGPGGGAAGALRPLHVGRPPRRPPEQVRLWG